ncbi:MAG TPA: DUF2793 domain-containing protein, partial [Arenicellales bacterium]|nr:DUF2793 domain-containing protein [Arenicellales bacterium]
MSTTADFGIPLLSNQQAQPEITHNEAIALLQALANGVISRAVNTPPDGSPGPQEGDAYIVGDTPTGDWAGRENCIAVYFGTAWLFLPGDDDDGDPITMGDRQAGICIWVRDEEKYYIWRETGSPATYAWVAFSVEVTAADVDYDNAASGLDGTTVKAALDELAAVRAAQAPIVEAGTSLTLTASHNGRVIYFTSASPITVTLPEAATETLDPGFVATLIKLGDGDLTLATEGADEYEAIEVG